MTTTRGSTSTSLFIYVKDAVSGKVNRLAIPADTQIGTVDKPAELMLTGRFSMNTRTVDVKNGSTVSMSNNDTILCVNEIDTSTIGAATIFLPSSPREGQIHHVKDVGGSSHLINIIVKPALTTQSTDGDSPKTIFTPYGSVSYFWSNGVWRSLQSAAGAASTVNLYAGAGIGIVTGSISGSTTYTINSLGALASYVVISTTSSLANERALAGSHGISIFDGGGGSNVTVSAEGLESAPYVTFGLTSSLSNEKVLTAGTNITITTSSNTIQVDVDVANQLQRLLFSPVAAWALQGAPSSATLWYDRTGHGNDYQGGTATTIPDLILSQSAASSIVLSGTRTQLNITGTMTLTSRVKLAGLGTAQVLIDVGNLGLGCCYLVGLDNTGHLYYFHETPGTVQFTMPVVYDFGEWLFISLRRTATGVITLGVNGNFATSTALGLPSSTAGYATLGTNDGKITPWLGQIADMVVWDVYLTDAQLADQRRVALGPLAYYTRHTGSATDNSIVRFDQGPEAIQTSLVTISDAGSITLPVLQTVDGRDLSVDGTKLDTVEAGAQVTSAARVVTALGLTTSSITFGTTLQTRFVGSLSASGGLSGSLQEVTPGVPYLIPGANITILTNSLGQVMISAAAGGGTGGLESYILATATGSLPNSRVLSASTGLIFTDNGPTSTIDYRIDDNLVATISGSRFRGSVVGLAGFTGSIFTTSAGLSFIAGSQGVTVNSASNGQITLGINNSTIATISGSTFQQLSGSLQKTGAGLSYLVAGANIVISSASNGQITITSAAVITGSSSGGSGDAGAPYITFATTSSLTNAKVLSDGIGTRVSSSTPTTFEVDAYPWVDAFDINFAVMPTMTASDGFFTMAGYTWRGNNIASGADFVGIVNGDGLRIDTNAASTDFFNGNETAPIVRLVVADAIPKFNLTDYELRLWAQFSGSQQDQNFEINSVGFSKQDFNSSLRYRVWMDQRYSSGYSQYGHMDWNSTESAALTTAPVLGNVHIMHLQNLRTASLYSALSTASYATPNSIALPEFASFTMPGPMIVSLASPPITGSRDLAISFAAMTLNGSNAFSASIQRMKLQYRIKSAEMPTNFVPNIPSFLMLTASGQLPNERYLVAGANITFNDAGPGKAFTITAATGSGGGGGDAGAPYITFATTASLTNAKVLSDGIGTRVSSSLSGTFEIDAYPWVDAFDINFSVMPTMTASNGSFTMAGYTWRGNNITSGADFVGIVNGDGLRIDTNGTSTDFFNGNETAPIVRLNVADVIPKFNLTDYELRLWTQMSSTLQNQDFEINSVGFTKQDFNSSLRYRAWNVQRFGGGLYSQYGNFDWNSTEGAASTTAPMIGNVHILHLQNLRTASVYSGLSTASYTTPNSIAFPGFASFTLSSPMIVSLATPPVTGSRDLAISFAAMTFNTANSFSSSIQRMKLQYRIKSAEMPTNFVPNTPSYLMLTASGQLVNERYLVAGTNISFNDAGPGGAFTITAATGSGGGGGGAGETAASYVVLSATSSLSNERVLTAAAGVSITDTGPGGNVIVGINTTTMSGSSGWATVLDLNLAEDGNFTFVTGSNVWHGLTWQAKNVANTSQFAIVSGTGLFIDYNAVASTHYPPNGSNDGPALTINLADLIPSFELASTRARVSMQFECNAAASFEYAEFGIERVANPVFGQAYAFGAAKFVDNSSDLGGISTIRRSNYYYYKDTRVANTTIAVDTNIMAIDYTLDSCKWFSVSSSAVSAAPNSLAFNPLLYKMDSRVVTGTIGASTMAMNSATYPFLTGSNRGLQLYIGGFTGNTNNTLTNTFKRLRVEYQNPATVVSVASSVASALTALSPCYYQGGLSGSTPSLAFTVSNTWTDLLSAVSAGTFTNDAQVGISRSSGNFTVTNAGLYMINVNCSFYDPSGSPLLGLRCLQNGTVRFSQQGYLDSTASAATFGTSGVLMLNASDVITFQYCISNSSTAIVTLTAGQIGGTNPSLMNINMVRIPSV